MPETEGMNFKVGPLNNNLDRSRKISNSRGAKYDNPSVEDIFKFINNLNIAEFEKEKLVEIIKKMPYGALRTFRNNYNNYLK
jgi:hypothetical protein